MMTPSQNAGHCQPATAAGPDLFPTNLPEPDTDRRFTFGLIVDVLDVLVEHGYQDTTRSGVDFIEMQQALFRFLYRRPGTPGGEL